MKEKRILNLEHSNNLLTQNSQVLQALIQKEKNDLLHKINEQPLSNNNLYYSTLEHDIAKYKKYFEDKINSVIQDYDSLLTASKLKISELLSVNKEITDDLNIASSENSFLHKENRSIKAKLESLNFKYYDYFSQYDSLLIENKQMVKENETLKQC